MRGVLQDGAIPLTSGAYAARGLIADAQRCINLIPELNPQETNPPATVTHYPRPGLRALSVCPQPAKGRGIFTTSQGQLLSVVGQNVYYIDRDWKWTQLGALTLNATSPVSFDDNGTTGVFVDGSPQGYSLTLATNTWNGPIVDPTGTFVGSTRVDYIDTFLLFNLPGTNQITCSLGLQVAFNALQIAAKSSRPDPIVTHAANLRQWWLLGSLYSEIWYLSGAVPFPFEEWPNVHVPYGCAAPYSLARTDSNLFWLSRNKDGECIVLMNKGYGVEAITTRALEYRFTNFATVQDAIGYVYQQGGHTIYVIHFPTADESWGFDLSTKQWHQRVSIDNNGKFHREKVAFHTFVSDKDGYPDTNVGQDWDSGQIYAMDQKAYTDVGMPMPCIRSFPHVMGELKEVTASAFVADMETGRLSGSSEIADGASPWNAGFSNGFGPLMANNIPLVAMRLSRDGGGTWGNHRVKSMVSAGHYRSMLRWRGLGMGRDLVAELSWSAPMPTALQGAYIEPLKHGA